MSRKRFATPARLMVAAWTLLAAGAATGGDADAADDVDVLVLEKSRFVTYDLFGEAGTITDQVVAFQRILDRKDAAAVFEALLKSNNANARVFALMGLHLADAKKFSTEAAAYKDRPEEVMVFAGCRGRQRKVSELVSDIASGKVSEEARDLGRKKGEALAREFGDLTPDDLRKRIGSLHGEARDRAIRFLGSRLEGEKNVDLLIRLLKSGDPGEFGAALSALEDLGPWGRKAADPLLASFKRSKLRVSKVLARLPPCKDALPGLKKVFEDRAETGEAVVILVGSLERFGDDAVPLLELAAKNRSEDVREAARLALESIRRPAR